VFAQQLLMSSTLRNHPFMQNKDLISVFDGGKSMSYDDRGAAIRGRCKSVLAVM
jgi:hypothetical protein